MVSLLTALVIGLLVAGVGAYRVPKVPGPLVSLSGVYLHWWDTGFVEPGTLTLIVLTLAGLLAVSGGIIRSVVVSRVGGVATKSAAIGSSVGAILSIFWGTAGFIAGLMVTVYILEFLRGRDVLGSLKAALVVALARLADKLVTILLTVAILVTMLLVIFL
jgi:uncharacterized protein YqgC (DUF456 family)